MILTTVCLVISRGTLGRRASLLLLLARSARLLSAVCGAFRHGVGHAVLLRGLLGLGGLHGHLALLALEVALLEHLAHHLDLLLVLLLLRGELVLLLVELVDLELEVLGVARLHQLVVLVHHVRRVQALLSPSLQFVEDCFLKENVDFFFSKVIEPPEELHILPLDALVSFSMDLLAFPQIGSHVFNVLFH